ncbi:circularly permuted type 2 ATP-grasp protein [Pararhodospirillum photometricum]|nr:circularly permuted type 2 ATP-grasp protein [Pararhodospirillum photometricum]
MRSSPTVARPQGALSPLPYPMPEGFDEMVDAEGRVRSRWQPFMTRLAALEPDELSRRWDRGLRLLRESGLAHDVPVDPDSTGETGRSWALDPIPLLVEPREWRFIERALVQRAALLNAVLADLYGPHHLLNEGQLPPALLHANAGFLRPLHGARPPGKTYLHFYAADLARSRDGLWWVIDDRTETPSGAGYALENRQIVGRVLPEIYRAFDVQRLAPFFGKAREALARLAPRPVEAPLIVVWTPGPYNESHHEHVYLARYLGLTLVEGEDMTTRDDRVYLKTLEGLKPIDVIVRFNEGSYCDPLELRGDSTLGVPGLVGAVHAGTVTIANALGARVAEAPAFKPFLPALCRRLLGEDLLMPSIATWWCGQEREQTYVRDHLESLVLRPAFNVRADPIAGDSLDDAARTAVLRRLDARPWSYVGQEAVPLSTVPVWHDGRLHPLPLVLRVHLVADGDGYAVMPGGLARVGPAPGIAPGRVGRTRGGGTKDTWVLSETPAPAVITVRGTRDETPRRGLRDLPSRVADNTCWLGRYAERGEDTVRLLRKACVVAAETGFGEPELAVVLSLFALLGHLPLTTDYSDAATQEQALRTVLRLNADPSQPLGLAATLANTRRTAVSVRDRLSNDTWRAVAQINRIPLVAPPETGVLDLETPQSALESLIMGLLALGGLALDTMTQALSWRFLDIGRRLERATHGLDLLTGLIMVDEGDVGPALDVALDVSDSIMTYRSRYLAPPGLAPTLDLLVSDESNPRSLAYQLVRLEGHMAKLSPDHAFGLPTEEQRCMARLLADVRTFDPSKVSLDIAPPDGQIALGAWLARVRQGLADLNGVLTLHYFAHALETRPEMAGHPDLEAALAARDAERRPEIGPASPSDALAEGGAS